MGVKAWTCKDSAELYNVSGWGQGSFEINDEGHVVVAPFGPDGGKIDLKNVVDDLVRRGLSPPLLLRFSDILKKRLDEICHAFRDAIGKWGYEGRYRPVMPIKVNQHRPVVEELIEFGKEHSMGLEVGSKPELLIAIALLNRPESLIVCNGYKDEAYIETALLSQRLGITTMLIVDRFREIEMIIKCSKRLNMKPNIGFRARLSAKGAGRWADSVGDRSKFGLTAAEMVAGVDALKEEGLLENLVCLHFHMGSQITAIRSLKEALAEASRILGSLYRMGAPLKFVDVGGGLAVDYDGSQTNYHASRNYTLEEYAADIIDAIGTVCEKESMPHPTIISESGRALVAHHSALVFNVLGQDSVSVGDVEAPVPMPEETAPQILRDLWEVFSTITRKNYQEAYHDAVQLKEDALSLFRHGILDLRARARVEELFWKASNRIWRIAKEQSYVPDELEGLEKELADLYFCNFSVFQSLPDHWAVDALFPIMPLHRLNERPTRLGILADLTCDSDGKVDQFIDLHDEKRALELHKWNPNEPYFVGIFLVGAYQEVLGDLHNLFGDVNAVHIAFDEERGYTLRHVVTGDKVKDVLSYVMYDERTLLARVRQAVEKALSHGTMTFEESASLVKQFEAGLEGYTYLEEPELANALLNSLIPQKSAPANGEAQGRAQNPSPSGNPEPTMEG